MVALSLRRSSEGGDGKCRRARSANKLEYRDVGRIILYVEYNEKIIRSRENGIVQNNLEMRRRDFKQT
jgi:hypothetical protein